MSVASPTAPLPEPSWGRASLASLIDLLKMVCELPRPHGRPTSRSPAPQSDLDPPTAEVPPNGTVL